jgi:hypothetical protein
MPRLRLTDYPGEKLEWSTAGGSQIVPTDGEIAAGWAVSDKPPARKINWLLDQPNKWLKAVLANSLGSYALRSAISANDIETICWAPQTQAWVIFNALSNSLTFYSYDGVSWLSGATWNGFPVQRSACHDTTGRVIVLGGSANHVEYISDVTTGTFTSVSTGLSAEPVAIRTKDGSDFVMALNSGAGQIAYANSVASSWTQVSTSAGSQADLTYISGSTWMTLGSTGDIRVSTNDGVSWVSGTHLSGVNTYRSIDVDPQSGRICVAGRVTASGLMRIYYSDDNGTSWTLATSPTAPVPAGSYKIRNLGGPTWVLVSGASTLAGAYFSLDGGENWSYGGQSNNTISAGLLVDVTSNGRQWLAAGENGQTARSPILALT